MNTCSVVIVNYNTGDLLKPVVIKALENACVDKIIVVDNASKDNSMSLLDDNHRLQKYMREKNYGFANSCNYGAQYVQSDYVMFLNPDCLIKDDTVKQLLKHFNNKKVGMVGCMVRNPDNSEQRAARRRLPTFLRAFKTFSGFEKLASYYGGFAGVNLNHLPLPEKAISVEAISGALMMMRMSVFLKLKGFDESYPLHFEDLDLFKRIIDDGHQIVFDPQTSVIHHQGTSSRSNPAVEQMKKKGAQRYFQKHCSYIAYLLIKLINKIRS